MDSASHRQHSSDASDQPHRPPPPRRPPPVRTNSIASTHAPPPARPPPVRRSNTLPASDLNQRESSAEDGLSSNELNTFRPQAHSASGRPPPPPTPSKTASDTHGNKPVNRLGKPRDRQADAAHATEDRASFVTWMSQAGPTLPPEPAAFASCIQYLMANSHVGEEGLFRVPGSKTQILELVASDNAAEDLFHVAEPATVAGFFKWLLRQQADLLWGRQIQLALATAISEADMELRIEGVRQALASQTEDQRSRLCWIALLFSKVVDNKSSRMTESAVATSAGPSLLPLAGVGPASAVVAILLKQPTILMPLSADQGNV